MKAFLGTKLAKALIATVIVVLLLGGGVLAYTTLWSGTASITIEEVIPTNGGGGDIPDPEPEPELLPLVIHDPVVSEGTIVDGVWTVTILQGEEATLHTYVQNDRDTEAWVELYTNGSGVNNLTVAPGVVVRQLIGAGFIHSVAPDSQLIVEFTITVDETAEAGTLPDVLLEIREKE